MDPAISGKDKYLAVVVVFTAHRASCGGQLTGHVVKMKGGRRHSYCLTSLASRLDPGFRGH
jgi:hypothetical protein